MSEAGTELEGQLLHAFLRDRDVPCPRCEYNLRDLVGIRCPECGDELVLRVNLSEPKLAAFLTGLIGIALGVGFNGLLLLFLIAQSLLRNGNPQYIWNLIICGTAVTGGAMFLYLRARKKLRRQTTTRQWLIASTCWAISLASLAIFTIFVR